MGTERETTVSVTIDGVVYTATAGELRELDALGVAFTAALPLPGGES